MDLDYLNDFFVNVSDRIRFDLCQTVTLDVGNPPGDQSVFKFRHVSYIEVRDHMNKLKNKTSIDYFNLNNKILKNVKECILYPLTDLINKCIDECVFPDNLKIAKVVPVPKESNTTDPSKMRPISILPAVSKVFKMILKTQIIEHFETNNLFHFGQFGFRSRKSTTDALMYLISKIIDGTESKEIVGAVFCDLTKAFDCVSHDLLISKLKCFGFENNSLKLLQSYLSGRTQYVECGNARSDLKGLKCGVPQGSVLGPVLFLLL